MSTFHILRQLHSIIGDALSRLEDKFQAESLDWPSLDEPYTPDPATSAAVAPDSVEAIDQIVAAAEQLITTVRSPAVTLTDASMSFYLPASLRYIVETHAVEILREAGPQGLHVRDIASQSDQDELKLGHVLRLLATHHIFREVKPDVFTNNRVSSFIDTGKSSAAIYADPSAKYDGTNGVAAFIGTAGDEFFKSAAYMTENSMDPKTKHSWDPSEASFQRALNTNKLFFPWLEETGRVKRFGIAMVGAFQSEAPDAILQAFSWESLPDDSLIVDVGGGIGSCTLKIAKTHPHLRVIVQDRPVVVRVAEGVGSYLLSIPDSDYSLINQLWKGELPHAVTSGRVQFQAQDFFNPQPCKNVSVFLIRAVCHDWPDAFVVKILKHLRDAAQPHTKLVFGDHIIPYACPDDSEASELPGATKALAPPPLLANLGRASSIVYWVDLNMQAVFHGQERTLGHIVDVLDQAGWKATKVHRVRQSRFGHITAEII
ncbi:S-adenosyl-L-methionine-dependent methyltransferase [Ramaria rubella]|nr:S-adenosyl-L-methionine-dependent methyltransferase [Ramaria rubella]